MFGFPWALAWAAHTEDWSRVALLSRWLAGVGPSYPKTQPGLPTVAEFCKTTVFFPPFKLKKLISLPRQARDKHWKSSEIDRFLADDYDCHRNGHSGCDGDPGNGVMVGWFLWAQVSRHHRRHRRHHLVIIIVIVIIVIVIIIPIIITSAAAATDVWCRCHAVPDAHPEEARSSDHLEAKA
jgi:hypothetical protein